MRKKLLISVALGLLFLWLAVRQVSLAEVRHSLRGVSYGILLWGAPLFAFIQCFRAWRLRLILSPLKAVPVGQCYGINAVGFLAILALPLRLGELARPYLFRREWGIPFSSGLAAIAVERVFDGLSIVLFFLGSLLLVGRGGEMLSLGGRQVSFLHLAEVAILMFVPAFFFLALLFFRRRQAERLIDFLSRALPPRWGEGLRSCSRRFIDGLSILPSPGRLLATMAVSLAIWLLTAFFTWVTFTACHLPLGMAEALAVQAIICVGISIPGGPGFIGNFQLFGVAGLMLFGIERNAAFALTVVNHFLTLLMLLLLGLVFLPRYNLRLSQVAEQSLTVPGAQP